MVRYVLLLLCCAVPASAQLIGDAAPVPNNTERSYGSIAFGYRNGSAVPTYSFGSDGRVNAGSTMLSVRFGTASWSLFGESTLWPSPRGMLDRHAVGGTYLLGGERTRVDAHISYAYHSDAVPIAQFNERRTESRRHAQQVMGGFRLSRSLTSNLFVFGGPLHCASYVQDSLDLYINGEREASHRFTATSGPAYTYGFDAGLRWQWRSLTLDGSIMPLWVPERYGAVAESDVVISGGINLRLYKAIGISVRAVRTRTDRSIAHLGSSITASATAAYP